MNNTDSLLDVVKTLLKWKKPIMYATGAVAVLSIVLSLTLSNYYKASAVFYPSNPRLASRGALYGAADENMDPFGSQADINRLMLVSESSELVYFIIDKFDLYAHYDIDSTNVKAPDKVRKAFKKLYNIIKNDKDALEISMEDVDPQKATDILWGILGKMDEINNRLTRANQEKILQSINQSISEKEKSFKLTSDSLNLLRRQYGIVNVVSQGEFLAEEVTKTEAALVSNKAKLAAMEKSSGVRRDSLNKIRALVKALEGKLEALTSKEGGISLAKFNEGREKVAMMEENQNSVRGELQFLRDRHFQYQSVYNTDISSMFIIEAPTVPVVKSRPRRSILVLSATLIGFILSALGALLFENYKEVNWKED